MRRWEVIVVRKKLKPDVHLEFYEEGCTAESAVPPFGVSDTLNLRLATSNKTGQVIVPGEDKAVIEVDGVRWRIRRAVPAERQFRSPRGMTTVEWIVLERACVS
jgi:hypothetical protein